MPGSSINRGPAVRGLDVAVIVPLYNKAPYIRAALESILAQTRRPNEIVVIDDGSTDNGPEIAASFAPQGVKLVRQPNAGPGIARNRGIEVSAARWVAFLDADDLWLPDHLAHLAALHRVFPEASVLASGYAEFRGHFPGTIEAVKDLRPRELDYFALDAGERGLSSSSVAVKRDAVLSAGGFTACFPGEDVDLWIRLGLDHRIVLSPKVTALYRRADVGLTHDYLSASEPPRLPIFGTIDAALADPRHRARHDLIRRYRDKWMLLVARQALARGNPKRARACLHEVANKDTAWLFLAALAVLPGTVVRGAIKARRMIS